MLVCGCGSHGAGVGADVGVCLSVIEHTAQYDTHLWTYHAPTAVWFLVFLIFSDFSAVRLFLSMLFFRCSLHGRISEHADRMLSFLRRGRKGCHCRRQCGGDPTLSRSSRVVSTSPTRLTSSVNRCASQRRRRISGAMTYDLHSRMVNKPRTT